MKGPHDLNCNHNHVYEHTDRKDMQIFCLVIFWRQDDVAMIYITKKYSCHEILQRFKHYLFIFQNYHMIHFIYFFFKKMCTFKSHLMLNTLVFFRKIII